jgi:hypothetical protein
MKTTRTILTVALVALTTTLFGRIGEPEVDCNCCPNEIILEQDQGLENWMTEPFDSSIEHDLTLESWMAMPIESSFENELALEEWMLSPFNSGFESELSVESWMTTPFQAPEDIELEGWMAAAWF